LNFVLSIFSVLILWSRVDGGIPSFAAAPDGPEMRPLASATRSPDCVGVSVAPDAREDVKSPPGQFACRGRANAARRTGYYDDLLDFH
jgi:hypothetical protein